VTSNWEKILYAVEKAIDQHTKLKRVSESKLGFTRSGPHFDIRATVRLIGSRKRPMEISAYGDTPEEAAEKFIEGLDYWAEALK
jgi:hypothetical protein